MCFSLLVTNQPPVTDANVSQTVLELFQAYVGQHHLPYDHQAQTFRLVEADNNVFLVAGTAAGKTLAIALPLFEKLKIGRIHKVLFMYPTIALMEDQTRVMRRLGELTGLGVSQIQGGMSRSQLITALNEPVILATPDAIYWFFHKNIKYSGLLVYALALVDEFVLDEAHLFNGLMLRNFEHLWRRVQSLAAILGNTPKLHILTATPIADLQRLNDGIRIDGRSKCGDVTVDFQPCGRFDHHIAMATAINQALDADHKKILVVCNAARMAHQLFEQFKVKKAMKLPIIHQLQFGRLELGKLLQFLEQSGVEQDILDNISDRLFREEDVFLSDLPAGTHVSLPLVNVITATTELLERECWQVKRALQEWMQQPGETLESLLHNRPLPCQIVAAVRHKLRTTSVLERQQAVVDEWLADILGRLSEGLDDQTTCQAQDFTGLQQALAIGLGANLAKLVVKRLVYQIKVDPAWMKFCPRRLNHRLVYLRWLDWLVEQEEVERIRALVRSGLESEALEVDSRHIGLWKHADVPVIVYSGSMAKHARSGLIDVFADLERAVLISTSAVEVGVDFVADMLITEECEGNSFLQRFGRVGRHGDNSNVVVLVSGEVAAKWRGLQGQTISREDFSTRVQETFPRRNYATASLLVDAGHYLINEQLGRIGVRLNQAPELIAARPIAEQLRAAEMQVSFGLRSTLPQISLQDGVTKDPFYLLRYVDDQDLRLSDSSFEVAKARVWFAELIFQKARFNVMVDLNVTLRASRVWFVLKNGIWRIASAEPGIGAKYLQKMNTYFAQQGGWNPWLPSNFLLLHGDVYLQRVETGIDYSVPEPICDHGQNPLFIPAQNYLVFVGWKDAEEARARIVESPIADWEELHYDWEGTAFNSSLVLLEKTTGACFAAYQEWLNYVDRRVQK